MTCPLTRFLQQLLSAGCSQSEALEMASMAVRIQAKINAASRTLQLTPAERTDLAWSLADKEMRRAGVMGAEALQ